MILFLFGYLLTSLLVYWLLVQSKNLVQNYSSITMHYELFQLLTFQIKTAHTKLTGLLYQNLPTPILIQQQALSFYIRPDLFLLQF